MEKTKKRFVLGRLIEPGPLIRSYKSPCLHKAPTMASMGDEGSSSRAIDSTNIGFQVSLSPFLLC